MCFINSNRIITIISIKICEVKSSNIEVIESIEFAKIILIRYNEQFTTNINSKLINNVSHVVTERDLSLFKRFFIIIIAAN